MSDYTWPAAWAPARFQMRVESNTRSFASPYTQGMQSIDLMADFWRVQIDMPPNIGALLGGQIEAFFDRLKGSVNRIVLWNLQRPVPLGSMRGAPTLSANALQFANTASVATVPGATLRAGDMVGIGGQLVRLMVDCVADGSGTMGIEFAPRLRTAQAAGAAVTWSMPTANFIIPTGAAPVDWHPGQFTAPSFELRESF